MKIIEHDAPQGGIKASQQACRRVDTDFLNRSVDTGTGHHRHHRTGDTMAGTIGDTREVTAFVFVEKIVVAANDIFGFPEYEVSFFKNII